MKAAVYAMVDYSMTAERPRHPLVLFEGIHRSDIGVIPSDSHSHFLQAVHQPSTAIGVDAGAKKEGFVSSLTQSFTRERDFQKLLPSIQEIDVFNPRNEALLRIYAMVEADQSYLFANR